MFVAGAIMLVIGLSALGLAMLILRDVTLERIKNEKLCDELEAILLDIEADAERKWNHSLKVLQGGKE